MLTQYGFQQLYPYLGLWGTVFLQTVFYIILIRIAFAFVLKIFRRNMDYRAPNNNSGYSKTVNARMNEAVKNTPKVSD